MSEGDQDAGSRRAADAASYVRHAARPGYSDDDPAVQRQLRRQPSRPKPLHWTRWLLIGIVAGAVLAGLLTATFAGGDDLVLGRVLLAAMGGAVVGWLTIVALARLGAFRRTDEL